MKRIRTHLVKNQPYAAALRYQQERDSAPRLVAKGSGELARKILAVAREAGVPVYEDPDLVALLMTLDIDELIPPELYLTIAEVLAFIYRLDHAAGLPERV
jgi:flagellar biosynthesis protein